jgi:hypothetical protein
MGRVGKQVKPNQGYNLEMRRRRDAHVSASNGSHFFDCPSGSELLTYRYTMYLNGRNSLQSNCTRACRMPLDGARGLGEELSNH